MDLYIEIVAVLLSLVFLFLLVRENIWCWLFGIISSLLSIYLFVTAKLYSEAVLYGVYVVLGFYGWWVWKKGSNNNEELAITQWSLPSHIIIIITGSLAALSWGFFTQKLTDAAKPMIDAFTTIFALIASYLEAHKILSTWIFWIIINGVSIWLYYTRGLHIYSGLMVVYFGVSIYGWFDWRGKYFK